MIRAALFVLAVVVAVSLIGPTPAAPVSAGYLELALLGVDRPVHVRLRVAIDDRPIAMTWRKHIENWFRFLDRDGDNIISEEELLFAPSAPAMLQGMRQGNIVYTSASLGIPGGEFGHKRSANLAEFTEYYLANGAGPISAGSGFATADPLSEALFKRLDRDNDGKLSRDELLNAAKTLAALDIDDDETISAQEISGAPVNNQFGNVVFTQPAQAAPISQGPSVIILGTSTSVERLFARYDRNKDGKLEPTEFGIRYSTFKDLDKDGDGTLSRDELRAWESLPAEVEWTAAWRGAAGPANPQMKEAATNRLALADMDIQFVPLNRASSPRGFSPAQYLLTAYKSADVNGRGYVEAAELKTPQFQILGQMFALLDRDKDGKLTEKEVQALVDLQAEALSCHVTLSFFDQGRGLFALLDTDRDGRLSAREMRDAWSRLEKRSKDGAIAREDIPRQCTLSAGLGFQALVFRPGTTPAAPGSNYPGGVPAWFIKMDTNGDGEVSRREFLGSDADFRRLDGNGDGFISAEEVMRSLRKE